MQTHLPKPQNDGVSKPFEFTEFIQENWIYLAIVAVIIYIVVMYYNILKDRRNNNKD